VHGDVDLGGLLHKSIAFGRATIERVLGTDNAMKNYLVRLYI
jgi:hypothetical protein